MGATQLWGKTTYYTQRGHNNPKTKGKENPHPKNGGNITILCKGSGAYNAGNLGTNGCETS